ncbi:uncharacterized protein B0P05DRAFT_568366 [Gilbertella persicaria]|uniref:uncharacterized protein n=1 Tax=Gilbertella persicaria TaxID=101096 RepID=UPI00221EA474|nr:uncharacterized protein B0P05DRAFT_568366 [Gilbertella persicaria]KAI8092176.1 hypothetical protein B0P05DRAFT_568366 [Gilbertella persicaria]
MSQPLPPLQPPPAPPAPTNTTTAPPASKWIQPENDESDSDQVGLVPHNRGYKHILFFSFSKINTNSSRNSGNKLRAPKTLAEESEFSKFGKTRTVVKRKRKRLEDGISDEEDDPYTLINIEDILSPIELPTDIVRRPALRRILLSTQIDSLAKTSMEFIEGEKNFNKILCRLSSIMHQDDPRYLDLSFDRTPEQRQKYKEDQEAAAVAATALSHVSSDAVDALDPKALDADKRHEEHKEEEQEEPEQQQQEAEQQQMSEKEQEKQEPILQEDVDMNIDTEAREVVKRVKELLLENINYSNEYIARLQCARNKLCKASMQKETLWKELKASAREEDNRNKAAYHH